MKNTRLQLLIKECAKVCTRKTTVDSRAKWKQFIREIMGYKGDLIAFLQTAAGWAISGDISEQSMFILY